MQEYEELKKKYYARFPQEREEKSIEALFFGYGRSRAVEIMKEAGERFIAIQYDEQAHDKISFQFEERQ
jgi:hypothetical protein